VRALLGFALLLGCSGLVKPSLAIVVFPVLMISLALGRRPAHLALVAAMIAAFTLVYMIPRFYADEVIPGAAWRANWDHLFQLSQMRRAGVFGVGTIVIGNWFYRWMRAGRRQRDLEWVGVLMIAALGAFLFDVVFRETGREFLANQDWPLAAVAVLLVPHLVCTALGWLFPSVRHPGAASRGLQVAVTLLVVVHVAGAAVYVARYPHIRKRTVPVAYVGAMRKARALSQPADRFLMPPSLTKADPHLVLQLYLARPVLMNSSPKPEIDRYRQKWTQLVAQERWKAAVPYLKAYDALITTRRTSGLGKIAQSLGWGKTTLGEKVGLELWQRPRSSSSPEPSGITHGN
jgi:hypothetical protein